MQNFKQAYPIIKYDCNMKAKVTNWLIENFWQDGKINGVAGFEKSGKSRLINWLLVGMSAGSVLGMYADQKKILYLCGEETVDIVNSRITRYAELQNIPQTQFDIGFIEAAAMRLDIKKERDGLLEQILDDDYQMLVIDPWRRVHGADEDKSLQMSPIYNDLRKWSNKHNLTIVLAHHTPKLSIDTDMTRMASWFRGSTDLPAILDTAQYVDRVDKHTIEVRRQGRFPPLPKLRITDLGGTQLNDDKGFELCATSSTKRTTEK